jgi:pimeloyl-ACP methyl ester carboxylesterase
LKEAIETRELITVSVDGVRLRGTCHRTRQDGVARKSRPGIFFFNPGFLPRAGTGDSAVDFADTLAQSGYRCFRFDVPGLGDSDGVPPEDVLDFINAGKYAPVLSATMKELVARYRLPGMVVVGHCAGGVSALFAAAITKECRGLVLMDPYFHLPKARPKLRNELSTWAGTSWIGGCFSRVYHLLKKVRGVVAARRLPTNANLPLLRCWKQVASAGMPILVLKASSRESPGIKPRPGEFDYLGHALSLAGRNNRVAIELVEGSNHSLADRKGKGAVQGHTQQWLNANFPPMVGEEATGRKGTGNLENVAVDV